MAFKTMEDYDESRYGGFFLLRNDKDYADVVFLYRGKSDVLVADGHYVVSPDYSGYVHCCGKGCPACGKGIRIQTKLFIPLYNYSTGKVEFWDRNIRFENQLVSDVFNNYPDPSEYVFRITRNGAYGDVNTTYSIVCMGTNSGPNCKSYSQILAENNIIFPNSYESVIKEYSSGDLYTLLNSGSDTNGYKGAPNQQYTAPNYQVSPRRSSANPNSAISEPPIPDPVPEIPNSYDPGSTSSLGEYSPEPTNDSTLISDVADELDAPVQF